MFRSDMDDVCNCRRWCTEGNCACLFSCFQRLVSRVGWVNSSKFVLDRNLTVRGKCLPKLKPTFDTFGLVGFVFSEGKVTLSLEDAHRTYCSIFLLVFELDLLPPPRMRQHYTERCFERGTRRDGSNEIYSIYKKMQ